MKTKIAYVLISSDKDIYLEQAYISMMSLKHHMPDAHIELLVDKQTEATLIGLRKKLLEFVDHLIVADIVGDYTPQQRSRLLKTSLRSYVEGDYLFIDSDTIITKQLYDIDDCNYSIAACQDSHSSFEKNPYRNMCVSHGNILEWPIEGEKVYFNSGVIYVKDDATARDFYAKWNELWIDGSRKGVNMDQPTFAKTNYELKHPVSILDDTWNCELKHGLKYLKDAKIVHYLCTNTDPSPLFVMNDIKELNAIKRGEINPLIIKCFDDPFVGLAQVSQLISGEDMDIINNTIFYRYFKACRGKWQEKLFDFLIKVDGKAQGILYRLRQIFIKSKR